MEQNQNIIFDSFSTDVVKWNLEFPIDRWWRDKYKVPYLSAQHKEACFLDMLFEYIEEQIKEKVTIKIQKSTTSDKTEEYVPGSGDFLKTSLSSNIEIDDVFDKLDISKIRANQNAKNS